VRDGDRKDGELGRHADTQGPEDDPPGERGQNDSAGSGERQLEARITKIPRAKGENHDRRQGKAVQDRGLAVEEDGSQDEYPHEGSSQYWRLRSDHDREGDDRDHGHCRRNSAIGARQDQEREHGGGQEGDVEPGDGEDMIDAGPAKSLIEVTRDGCAIAKEKSTEEGGRRGRERVLHDLHGAAPDPKRPRWQGLIERHDPICPSGRYHVDSFAGEIRRVVEDSGVAKAGGFAQA
jgi:hypothetical protein